MRGGRLIDTPVIGRVAMRIFVINLKRSADRKAYITRQLEDLNVACEFVDAIDGQELSDDEIKTHGVDAFPAWPSFNQRQLRKGEIGCLLSHLGIYRRMIAEDMEWACILEDDCGFEKDFGGVLRNARLGISDYELLLLGHSGQYRDSARGAACSSKKEPFFASYRIAKPVECPHGTYAYIIKQSAARKLLQYACPLRFPMDYLIGHAPAIGLKLRVLTPPIVIHNGPRFASAVYAPGSDRRLYVRKARRIRDFLGCRYPILRKIKKICLLPFVMLRLKLRMTGILDGDSYVEKRFFQQKSPAKPAIPQ